MTNAKNCLVCGKEFVPCNACLKGIPEVMQWKKVVCCKEHFAYHYPIIMFHRGDMSKSEAKELLTQAINDYGEVDFVDNIKPVVDEILAEPKVENKKKFVKKNPVEDIILDKAKVSVIAGEE